MINDITLWFIKKQHGILPAVLLELINIEIYNFHLHHYKFQLMPITIKGSLIDILKFLSQISMKTVSATYAIQQVKPNLKPGIKDIKRETVYNYKVMKIYIILCYYGS